MNTNYREIRIDNAKYANISLNKLLENEIVDVECWISGEFGKDNLVIELYTLVFKDGRRISIDAEHDIAYVNEDIAVTNQEQANINKLYNEQHGFVPGDDLYLSEEVLE